MIFQWFPLDFVKSAGLSKQVPPPTDDQIVLAYLASHAPVRIQKQIPHIEDLLQYKVIYKPFDWSLNEIDKKRSVEDTSVFSSAR